MMVYISPLVAEVAGTPREVVLEMSAVRREADGLHLWYEISNRSYYTFLRLFQDHHVSPVELWILAYNAGALGYQLLRDDETWVVLP